MRALLTRFTWLCPAGMLLLAVVVALAFAVTWWNALLLAVLLACPIAFLWAAVAGRLAAADYRRPPRTP